MPRATTDVSCRFLTEVIFKNQAKVVGAIEVPGETFVRLVINGMSLPEPKEDGTPRRVNTTITEEVKFNAID